MSENILACASSKISLGGSDFASSKFRFTLESRHTWAIVNILIYVLWSSNLRKSCVVDVDFEDNVNMLSEDLFTSPKTF